MYQETSAKAYVSFVLPTLGDRQKLVYDEICKHDNITNTELSKTLGLEINQITPRTNELVKKGYVQEGSKRVCRVTGKTVLAWRKVRTTLFD